jgi:hypothetical protein
VPPPIPSKEKKPTLPTGGISVNTRPVDATLTEVNDEATTPSLVNLPPPPPPFQFPVVPPKDTKPTKTNKVDRPTSDANSPANVGAMSPAADAMQQQASETKLNKSKNKKPPLTGGPTWSKTNPTKTAKTTVASSAQRNNAPPSNAASSTSPTPLSTTPTPSVIASKPSNNAASATSDKKAKNTSDTSSSKNKKDKEKEAGDDAEQQVPKELRTGVVTHIREPLVEDLLRGTNLALTYKGETLVSMAAIPDVFFDKKKKKNKYYNELYAHCTKQNCIAEFICITEIDELTEHHGNYKKFMKMFHEIWTKRIHIVKHTGHDVPRKNPTRDEDRHVNLDDAEHMKALQGFIDKYWDSANEKPKKLSQVV